MRVGIIYLGRHGPGGPISLFLAREFARTVEVFGAISGESDYVDAFCECDFPIIQVPTFTSKAAAIASYLNPTPAMNLAGQIRKLAPDVIVYPMVHPWTPRLQRLLKPIPDVVVVHDPVPHPGFFHRLSSAWERSAARNATRCVVLGQVFTDTLVESGIAKEAIDVIPLGMLSHHETPNRSSLKPAKSPTILFFGRITTYKGLDVLLRAFEQLVGEQPDLKLRIVGAGDLKPYRQLLTRIPNIEVTNEWVADDAVAGYFNEASFIVLPYTTASQSGVIATASVFGTPVIATRTGALPEQITEGVTGLLVEPGSVGQLEEAMRLLIRDPDRAQQLGGNLAIHARETLNWNVIGAQFLETCRNAVSGPDHAKLESQQL